MWNQDWSKITIFYCLISLAKFTLKVLKQNWDTNTHRLHSLIQKVFSNFNFAKQEVYHQNRGWPMQSCESPKTKPKTRIAPFFQLFLFNSTPLDYQGIVGFQGSWVLPKPLAPSSIWELFFNQSSLRKLQTKPPANNITQKLNHEN